MVFSEEERQKLEQLRSNKSGSDSASISGNASSPSGFKAFKSRVGIQSDGTITSKEEGIQSPNIRKGGFFNKMDNLSRKLGNVGENIPILGPAVIGTAKMGQQAFENRRARKEGREPREIFSPKEALGTAGSIGFELLGAGQIARGKEVVKKLGVPRALRTLRAGDALKASVIGGGIGASGAAAQDLTDDDIVASGLIGGGIGSVTPLLSNKIGRFVTPRLEKLFKIQEKISPKLTGKVKQQVIKEGRVVEGRSKITGGKDPDVVLPSDQEVKISETIHKNIPKAHKLDQFTLNNKIVQKTDDLAKNLSSDMKKAQLFIPEKNEIRDSWEFLKIKQKNDEEFLSFPIKASEKIQQNFEIFINNIDEVGSLDDLWKLRVAYDKSIPSSVKSVQEIPGANQFNIFRKNMWLQNREIFNDAIKDKSRDIGEKATKSFSEMSDLYQASQNIVQRGDIDLKGSSSFVNKISGRIVEGAAIGGGLSAAGFGGGER